MNPLPVLSGGDFYFGKRPPHRPKNLAADHLRHRGGPLPDCQNRLVLSGTLVVLFPMIDKAHPSSDGTAADWITGT